MTRQADAIAWEPIPGEDAGRVLLGTLDLTICAMSTA